MNFRNEAIELRAMGFHVFPVHGILPGKHSCTCGSDTCTKNAGKHPRVKNWQTAAASATIDDYETWHHMYPTSNIAISTSDLIVIDIDDSSSAIAVELLPMLPETLKASTGRSGGGTHWYYRPSVPSTLSVHQLGGVDIRARGGLVVAPPSMHKSGVKYAWLNEGTEIAQLPEDVIRFLQSKVRQKPAVITGSDPGVESTGLIPEGQRHDYLRREIFKRIAGGRMSREEIQAVAEGYLADQVEGEIDEMEIEKLIDGAYSRKGAFRLADLSESGIAEKYVEYWKDDLVRLESGEWLQQDNGVWVPCVSPENLFRPVRQTVYEVNMEYEKRQDDPKTEYLNKFYAKAGTWNFAKAVISFATPDLTRKVNDFTTPPDTIPFTNGLYDMVTGEFRAFRSEDNVVSTVGTAFDPGATAPLWESTIAHVTGGDEQFIRFHRQVFGYLLSTRTMRGVFFLVGPKSTGKTTLITTLAEVMGGRYAGTAQLGLLHHTRSFSEDEDMARTAVALVGKRFVFMDETKKDAVIDPAKFKRIASRDAVLRARHLRYDAFDFTNKAKVVILTNNQPNIDVEDDAAWDRVMYVPFVKSIPKEERREGFKDELLAEAAGILNWCIAGFQDYEQHGFVIPDAMAEQVSEWQVEDNPVAQFVEACCIVEPSVRSKATVLWERYNLWRELAGYGGSEHVMKSAALFGKSLQRLLGDKVTSKKANGVRGLVGIALKN